MTSPQSADAIEIRTYKASDASALAVLFFDSVQRGTARSYDAKQRNAWAAEPPEAGAWHQRLAAVQTWVAHRKSELLGFITLDETGYIDLAYVHWQWIGLGIAEKLYTVLESQARQAQYKRLHCHASDLARSFFAKQGWRVVESRSIVRNQVELSQHIMEKQLI